MIYRTYDMSAVNAILSHVWDEISDIPKFDLPYDASCLYYMVDGGVVIFNPYLDGVEIHPTILPEKRGKSAYIAVEESIQRAFSLGYKSIYCEIPIELKHVVRFAKDLGFKSLETGRNCLMVRRKLDS